MIKLKRPVVKRRAISVDVGMLPDGNRALAFVWMRKMRHDNLHVRKAQRHVVDQQGQRVLQRRLANESRPGMAKNRQAVPGGVMPEVIKMVAIGSEPRVHGHQLDSLQVKLAMALFQLVLPAGLCRVQRQKTDQAVGRAVYVRGDFMVRYPQARKARFAAKDDRLASLRCTRSILRPANRQVDAPAMLGLLDELGGEMIGIAKIMTVNVGDHTQVWIRRSALSQADVTQGVFVADSRPAIVRLKIY